jgi:O-acetylserine/cysteine efflux transporter
MPLRDMLLAAMVSVIWGLSFVASRIALDDFSPAQLTLIRFLIACLPALFVPRPPLPWPTLLLTGSTIFAGQFLLLFFAFAAGMPPGLASVTQQMQAFFTVLLAAVFLHDIPTRKQCFGMAIAFAGLVFIATTIGGSLPPLALGLALGAAMSWAIGNVIVKRHPGAPVLSFVVWCSLVPPLPALALSMLVDRDLSLLHAIAHASGLGLAAAVYLGAIATIVAYAIWGRLLQRHSTAVVAPFALIAPCAGIVASKVVFGEMFTPLRLCGMALILAGLAVTALPLGRARRYALSR